eukprot:5880416-Amphidinium_carterae.3
MEIITVPTFESVKTFCEDAMAVRADQSPMASSSRVWDLQYTMGFDPVTNHAWAGSDWGNRAGNPWCVVCRASVSVDVAW